MTETIVLCVAVVVLTATVVWSTGKRWAAEDDAVRARAERDAAQVCRDAARRERRAAVSALEALRRDLADSADIARGQVESLAAECDTLRTYARTDAANAAMLARLVIELGGREHVESDPAGEIRRDRVTRLTDFGSRP